MKFPLVSRKKYEIAQNNYKLVSQQRRESEKFSIRLQEKLLHKYEEIETLKF